jgi:methylated-DNA-[protein]-cysteine S-methyltransferase
MRDDMTPPGDREAAKYWTAGLESYFRGERLSWTLAEVPLDRLGVSGFARRVYTALLEVPAGTTVTYGELARMAGHPGAARAVGTAMAGNPVPIVVPCHRVVRADGSLGEYGDDPRWKPILLAHERRHAEVRK